MSRPPESQFAEFYDATWGRTFACTYAMTGDVGVAEELAQEAYTRAWARWHRLVSYDDPAAWVRQVASRLAVSRWRRAKVSQAWLARNRRTTAVDPPDETSMALVAALRQLPEAQRRSLVLHYLADLPVHEVARIERCPTGTIKARLSRGRAAMATLLADAPLPSPSDPTGEPSHA